MSKLVMSKILESKLRKIKDCPIATQLLELPEVEDLNYLSERATRPEYISYLNKSRLERYGYGKRWRFKIRTSGRPGGIVKQILPNASDKEVEAFVNKYLGISYKNEGKIKIVYGDKIKYYYHQDRYESTDGDLGNSCMRHDICQSFFGIYTKNPDHVGMAIVLNNEGKIKARCLIWYPNTKKDKSLVFFDRIYAIDDRTELELYSWCINNNFVQISTKNINKPRTVPEIKITLPNLKFKSYPYVDSLNYLDKDGLNNLRKGICLDDTDGGLGNTCDCCGSDSVDLESARGRRGLYCEDCRTYSEYYGEYLHNDDVVECDITGDYYLDGDVVELYNGNNCWDRHIDLLCTDDCEYFIRGDDNFIQPEGSTNWYHIDSDSIEKIDGTYYIIDSPEYIKINEDSN